VLRERTDDMRTVYCDTRILLVPSQWEDETWGRVVSEAQLSGIPVITSDRGGLPESVGPGGIVLPCISSSPSRAGRVRGAVADGSPQAPRVDKPARERGAPSVGSISPNSRRGRAAIKGASPHAQGREMENFVGIDVAKDRLDVHLRPSGESFAIARDSKGLAA